MMPSEGLEENTRPSLSGSRQPLLVGRSRELLVLRAQLADAFAGSGSVVVIGGEAGIGKSRLASTLSREAGDAGALVLTGQCYDFSVTPPYGPWMELIEQSSAAFARFPDVAALPFPDLSGGLSQPVLVRAMRDFFLSIARDFPLVIVLEDVQWADDESLDLLRYLSRHLSAAPILLLITYRSNEVTRAHPLHWLVPVLVREALAVRIDVSLLTQNDVRALIDDAYGLPGASADRLAAHVQQRAEGNPFFIVELLRALEGSVILPDACGGWMLGAFESAAIPKLLRQVIDQRLLRLGASAGTLLTTASIIGQLVPLETWESVSGVPGPDMLDVVERAVDANVLEATEDGKAVRFTHALIRDSLYESVFPPRRRMWHLRIAEALAASDGPPDLDQIAYHFQQAGDGRAVEWFVRAGERAQRAFAWRTAAQRFETALELLDEGASRAGERGWLEFRLAMLRRFEDPLAGVHRLEAAERLGRLAGDRALAAYARFFQGMLRCQSDDFRLGVEAEESGVAMLDALDASERARLRAIETTADPLDAQHGRGELTLALAENARLQQARALGERIVSLPADEIVGSHGDAWYGLGYAYTGLGQPDAARHALQRSRAIFAASNHRSMVATSLFDELMIVVLPYQIDRQAELQRLESALAESLASLEDITGQGSTAVAFVVSKVLAGEWADAFALLEQCTWRLFRRNAPMLLAPIARWQGNAALAWSLIEQHFRAGAETEPEDTALDTVGLRSLAVALALDARDFPLAQRWLDSFDGWLRWSESVLGRADALLSWASYAHALGDDASAREHAMQAGAAASAPRQPLTLLATERLLGELDLSEGHFAEAEKRFATALSLADMTGAAHERALTLLSRAELEIARSDFVSARELLDAARQLCAGMQAVRTLAQVDTLESRLVEASQAAASQPISGLTRRETDVLRLLATGQSNAEIAWELNVSPRTIDTHLTNIYAKFGVTTRGAAIRLALENGLR